MLSVLVLGDDLLAMLSHATVRMVLIDHLFLDNVLLVASLEQVLALGRVFTLVIDLFDMDDLFSLLLTLTIYHCKANDAE